MKALLSAPPPAGVIVWFDEKAPMTVKEHGGRRWTNRKRPKVLSGQKVKGKVILFGMYVPARKKVHTRYFAEQTHQEVVVCLKYLKRLFPEGTIHVLWDNRSIHTRAEKEAWTQAHPEIQFSYQPTQSAHLNPLERFFLDVDTAILDNSRFGSVHDLVTAVKGYVRERNRKGVVIRSPLDPPPPKSKKSQRP